MAKENWSEGVPHRNYTTSGVWGRRLDSYKNLMLEHIRTCLSVLPDNKVEVPQFKLHNKDGSYGMIREINAGGIIEQSAKDSSKSDNYFHCLDLCTLAGICDYLDWVTQK